MTPGRSRLFRVHGLTVAVAEPAREGGLLVDDSGPEVHLDGTLLRIDGQDAPGRGTNERSLRAVAGLFRRFGTQAWQRLDGSFFLAVRAGDEIHLGVDLTGTRAMYWWHAAGRAAVAPNLLDATGSWRGDLDVDPAAAGGYLAGGILPPGLTAIRAVRHLGAGQHLTMTAQGAEIGRHARLVTLGDSVVPDDELVERFIERAEAAVARRLRVAERPIVPLSGGLDSRYLAAEIARQHDPASIRTVTWGEAPERPASDAVIAREVAARLGVPHEWRSKEHTHDLDSFARAIEATSGEGDGAIHFPGDDEFHRRLASDLGPASLFRGDELFESERRYTEQATAVLGGATALSVSGSYASILPGDVLRALAEASQGVTSGWLADLVSRTPTARRDELWYEWGFRRGLAPYNALKHRVFDVQLPFLDAEVIELLRHVPPRLRTGKRLVHAALSRRFPEVAALPFATRDNLPAWERRATEHGRFAEFLRAWFEESGWVHEIGAREGVLAAIDGLAARRPPAVDPSARRRSLRAMLMRTAPGTLALEIALARRARRNSLPAYLPLARLAVLHGIIGRARAGSGTAPIDWDESGPG